MQTRIKELRTKRLIRQSVLARNVGTTQQTISRIENELYMPPVDLLIRIAEYFHVSVDYLLCLTEIKRTWEGEYNFNRIADECYDIISLYNQLNMIDRKTALFILKRLRDAEDEVER